MPRVKRNADAKREEVYELTPEEVKYEQELFDAEGKILDSIKRALDDPRGIRPNVLGYLTSSISKLRSESRQRYKLRTKLRLTEKDVADNPEQAKSIAISYLSTLLLADRLAIYEEVRPDETLVAWLAGVDEGRLKGIYARSRAVRHGDADLPPESEVHPALSFTTENPTQ